jgi:hypothetical protein
MIRGIIIPQACEVRLYRKAPRGLAGIVDVWGAQRFLGGVSRSGFHAWLTRAPSQRARSDAEIGAKVKASHIASYRTYGARRVWHDMLAEGSCVACTRSNG